MKYLIVIPDGSADNPIPSLGGMTPLEAADIPTMDMLASKGDDRNGQNRSGRNQPGKRLRKLVGYGL